MEFIHGSDSVKMSIFRFKIFILLFPLKNVMFGIKLKLLVKFNNIGVVLLVLETFEKIKIYHLIFELRLV